MKLLYPIAAFCNLALFCTIPPKIVTYVSATIPVVDERLSLSPLISEAHLEKLPEWPSNPEQQKILLEAFDDIWNKLLAEFRRCQKYGFYTMVDDNDNPTIRISVTLTDFEFNNDTLKMPIRLQAERLSDDQRFIYKVPATAAITSSQRNANPYHFYGQLLSEYRRCFPYKILVSFFYRHKID